jgi:hypothetical protein
MLKKVFDFAVEHPQIIAGIFIAAILPIGSLVTAIGSLASVLSPTAPFILAAAAFAGSWALAADNMERYSGEYRRNLNLSTNQLSAQDQSNRTATTANRVAQFDQLLGEGTIDDIMTGYGGRSAAMSPFRGAGMSLVRGAARVASGAGFTDASRSMNAYAFSEDVLASEAGMGLAQRVREILNSGAQSPQQIARSIEQARQRFASNPTDAREFDRNLRSQFGISESEDIGSSLLRKITALDPDYRPPRATSTPAAPAASGQSSVAPSAAPATDTTAAAPTNTAAMRVRGQQIQIVASDVVIDGRRVGEVMFEISRRT